MSPLQLETILRSKLKSSSDISLQSIPTLFLEIPPHDNLEIEHNHFLFLNNDKLWRKKHYLTSPQSLNPFLLNLSK
ncbi:hypothetical protein HNQ88_002853 [Aureibacter tunicatorum]|uniref:Uncharacterized protein n=1 Tax=Aureibacter tunicatorum TaxID=866807 RepID=A0AAE3XPS6_9BACT|nr:hypothetical protein [Aureibacter tunicatorum]BDD04280.1 hypothetical protein AUTU_17630 [Aureibacter tunicatorum]